MTSITDAEWDKLSPENFDTTALLRAVDAVGALRLGVSEGEGEGGAPALRTELLKLHQLAMAVINNGSRAQVGDLFELAVDLEDQVRELGGHLEQVQETLSQLTELYPESLSYGDADDEATDQESGR